jgi:hypothetical protein
LDRATGLSVSDRKLLGGFKVFLGIKGLNGLDQYGGCGEGQRRTLFIRYVLGAELAILECQWCRWTEQVTHPES